MTLYRGITKCATNFSPSYPESIRNGHDTIETLLVAFNRLEYNN